MLGYRKTRTTQPMDRMERTKEIRHSRSYAFDAGLHEKLQELANKHTDGNRSRMAEKLIEDGIRALPGQDQPPKAQA